MATYVTLVNFTDQGMRNYTDSPKRAEAFKEWSRTWEARSKRSCGPWGPRGL